MWFEECDGSLHRLSTLQDLSNDQFIVVEEPANFCHSVHQGAVDDGQRSIVHLQCDLECVIESFLGSFDDISCESFWNRQVEERRLPLSGDFSAAKVFRELCDGIGGALPDEVFAQSAFLLRDTGVAIHSFRVDDRHR